MKHTTREEVLPVVAGIVLGAALAIIAVLVTMALASTAQHKAQASLDRQAVRQIAGHVVDKRLKTAGLTGKALNQKMEQAIIAFIKSRAAQSGHASNTKSQPRRAHNTVINAESIDPATEPVAGNPDARYQLIVYTDYECPFCKRFYPTLETVIQRYGKHLAVTLRDFPLPMHGKTAVRESVAAQCVFKLAGDQAFWAYSEAIYNHTRSNGRGVPGEHKLADLATKAGVKRSQFKSCLQQGMESESAIRSGIRADLDRGNAIGVRGTPSSVLLDTRTGKAALVVGAQPLSAMTSALNNLIDEG